MVGAQDIRCAAPFALRNSLNRRARECARRAGMGLRIHGEQTLRPFGFGPRLARQAEERGDGLIARIVQQRYLPPERGRGKTERGDRMAGVVLAVAKGAAAVFPRLTP